MRTIPAELVKRYEAEGWWTRETLGDLLAAGLADAPDAQFRVHSAVRPYEGTYGDVDRLARRLAAGLRARGVRPGDVIAAQLPNWVEAAAVFYASSFLGTVLVPIVHFYGRKELDYILRTVQPKVFITAERFGRMERHPDLSAGVPIVGVVDRDPDRPGEAADFDDLLADEPLEGVIQVDPGAPTVIAFTSGTTRDPKGVVHSHQTLVFETRQLGGLLAPDRGAQLTGAPVGHFIGMLNAFLLPVLDRLPINLIDVWDPAKVLRLLAEGLTVGGGATYFITSLIDHPDFVPGKHLEGLRYAGLGGSSVPVAITSRLTELGVTAYRSYGSTEHPSITGSPYSAPLEKRIYTDGDPMTGVEIQLAEDGEILSRGPDLCLGYLDPELTAKVFDADGWYHTGDVGVLDADGYLTIVDRKADFIIRGGENISALEVEEALLGMPAIAEVAVVAAPDPRLGERAAAVLRLLPGHEAPTLEELREYLTGVGLARQKWPEEIHTVPDFPRTASGKIQKVVLRGDIAARRARE
ncbi:AMP-binding protein [Frankia sp. CNm7]|uniref:AMP-binding protein n=1 Tax=Frankia nepalensis TaxID=1836974 RepID=A0A937RJN5_9ACTN|nr:AMP-binding protein [Frankia nepalensis]MBL7501249.1 AMP-binding protein [Frankia nepalensis]MBL7509447.1 AMP-binding protein [Frankia nepalensis]MBL7518407.1 AMP-binding protein [Frankia nepalensis]MBL7631550.1 AMP-binding protein [Frankia nepalensis]